ncbi:hypothetical protein [Flavobacterium daejeonense]|uniref:hypothetical protein n=1 Tax=Flavobacterium daejeonense TaxID=350893 RepID=UPI0012DEBD57|nr:hypothetical protein [Flavobacterium daejeonense]
MTEIEIIKFLKGNIEPIQDNIYGLGFCASVTLKDGTFLPCVIFRNPQKLIELAIRRFKEEQSGKSIFASKTKGLGYREIVKTFVTKGNCVNIYDIANVQESRFAIPPNVAKQIHGETAMSWTAFVAEFNDKRKLSFGTSWNMEFFDLPNDYDFKNVTNIISGVYLSKDNEIVPHKSITDFTNNKEQLQYIHREKPFFECFVENL